MLCSCTYTTTTTSSKEKEPVFIAAAKTIEGKLYQLISCEMINLAGVETTVNGITIASLEIDIINGRDVPNTKRGRKDRGYLIAKELKRYLADKRAYDTYTVVFAEQETAGALSYKDWSRQTFNATEL